MRDTDNDIEELEGLIGHAKRDYLALRHEGRLADDRMATRPPRPVMRYAIAASALLVASAVALGVIDSHDGHGPGSAERSQLAISRPESVPLSLRPTGRLTPPFSADRPGLAIRLRLPDRPSNSSG